MLKSFPNYRWLSCSPDPILPEDYLIVAGERESLFLEDVAVVGFLIVVGGPTPMHMWGALIGQKLGGGHVENAGAEGKR